MCPAVAFGGSRGASRETSTASRREKEREREGGRGDSLHSLNPLTNNLMTKLAEEISDESRFSG